MDEEIKGEILQDEDADVFREALAYLQQKAVVSYADFKRLREWYRPLAFSVSGYTSLEVLNTFLEELQKAVESGSTKRDFMELQIGRFGRKRVNICGLGPVMAG